MAKESHQGRSLLEKEKNRINTIATESKGFVPVNLELKENAGYFGKEGYDVEKAAESIRFIDEMLNGFQSGLLTLDAEQRALLTLQKGRYQSFLHLNAGKFSGDSREMVAVKTQLGVLEAILHEPLAFDEKTFAAIELQYTNVIRACQYYIDNKNPWFESGVARKQLVAETMARISEEKKTFLAAKAAYQEGFLGEAKFETPYKLMEAHLAAGFADADSLEAYNQKMAGEADISREWIANLMEQQDFAAFFERLKEKNRFVTEEDAKYQFLNKLINKAVNFDKNKEVDDQEGQPGILKTGGALPPILGDFGEVMEASRDGIKKGVASKGDLSRRVATVYHIVRRDNAGEPLTEEDRVRSEQNDEWVAIVKSYYEAKAKEKEAGANPSEDVAREFEAARKKLWEGYIKRMEGILDRVHFPTPEELAKDPFVIPRLAETDFDLFFGLYGYAGSWSEMRLEGLGDYQDAYVKEHPDFSIKMDMLTDLKYIETNVFREMRHINAKLDPIPASSDPYNRYMDVMNNPAATDQQKAAAKEEYDDELAQRQAGLDGLLDSYREHYGLYKNYTVLTDNEKKAYRALEEIKEAKSPETVVEEQRDQGREVSEDTAKIHLLLGNAMRMEQMPEYLAVKEKMEQNGRKGSMSREVASLLQLILRKNDGTPLDAEEQEKQEWNKRWLSCYRQENMREEKKALMQEAIPKLLNVSIPTPDEWKAHGTDYYFKKDPVKYAQLMMNLTGLGNLKQEEPELFQAIVPPGSLLDDKFTMLTLFSGYLNQFVESNYGMLPGSGYCFLEKEAWDARAIPDVKRRIHESRIASFKLYEEEYQKVKTKEANRKKTGEQLDSIFGKSDFAPMDLSKVNKNSFAYQKFLEENDVEEAKKEANIIDKILQGVNLDPKAKDRLFGTDRVDVTQSFNEMKGAIGKLGLTTVTGLKHKQTVDMVHVLLNNKDKDDSDEMESVKKDLLSVALVMEENKNKEAQKDVIEKLDVAIHLAITSCSAYLSGKNPWTTKGQQRYQAVYAIWSSLICEQRLIMVAYNSATQSREAGHPVTLGELFGMSRTSRERHIIRPQAEREEDIDGLSNLQQEEHGQNLPGMPQLSETASHGVKVLGSGYIFVKAIKDANLKEKDARAEAAKVLAFRKRINEFPRGQVCAADIDVFGKKVRILQKSDNTLYVIDDHREIPVGNKTFDAINNQIEAEIVNNPGLFGDAAVSELLNHYRSNNMTGGEHLRVRQAMIDFLAAKTGMVPNEFSNVVKGALADFTERLIRGNITPQEIINHVREEINKGDFVNGVELAEMVELNRNRNPEQMNAMVVMQAEAQQEAPMEDGWTEEEKAVKGFVADLIFSQETWEMDASISSPEGFVADMLHKHAPAVLALVGAKRQGQDTADIVGNIMEKMSLSELDGLLNGERIRLTEVVRDAVAAITNLVEAQLLRFNEGGDLADRQVEANDAARLDYLFNNTDDNVKAQLRTDMRGQLSAVKKQMDTVVDKAGQILQENVKKITATVFPEQDGDQEEDLADQSLSDILANATKSAKGQGKFIRNVLNTYFGEVSNLDKRAMLASVIRSAKKVTVDDLSDEVVSKRLKKEKPEEFGNQFANLQALTEEERRAIDEYRNAKKELRTQSNFLAGLLRGAGPLMHKLMQGMPTRSLPPEITEALKDMKTDLPPIPEEIVRTRFAAMVESSGGAVTKIEKIRSLGAASVGQAFLCKVYGPGMKPEGEEVVIKLLRPEASNRMKREEAIMLKCAEQTDAAMKATYEGQIAGYRKELDLSVEAANCRQGQKAYKEELDKLPANKKIKDVKTMTVFEEIPATSNSLVIKKAPGVTLDAYIRELRDFSSNALKRVYRSEDDAHVVFDKASMGTVVATKKQLLDKMDEAVKRRDHLLGLVNVWITQAVCKTGFYHGDLHAGNIMVDDDKATFIDYGNAVQLSPTQQANLAKMTLAASLSVVKKYKTVEETVEENGKKKTVKRTVLDTEKMNKINDDSVDLFFTSFNEMLAESNDEAANAAYTEEKKTRVRAIFKSVLQKGGMNDTGARIAAAILKVQEIGVKVPPAMQNFSQGQIRLQNSIDELNEAIDGMERAARIIDTPAVSGGMTNDPVLIVQFKVHDDCEADPTNEAGDIYRHVIKELEPLNEDEFVEAILDNKYVEGDMEQGIRPIDKRKEFDQFYFKGVLRMRDRFNQEEEEDRLQFEAVKANARGWIKAYFDEYRDRQGSREQILAGQKLAEKLTPNIVLGGMLDGFGGTGFFSLALSNAASNMDEDFFKDFLVAVEELIPMAMEMQGRLDALRKAQDDKQSKEVLTGKAREIYRDFTKIWSFGMKRHLVREKISQKLDHPSSKGMMQGLEELTALTENGVGARIQEKLDIFVEIKNRDVKEVQKSNGTTDTMFSLSPENAQVFMRAKRELLDVIMEGAVIRLKNFTRDMHGKKPNYKFVNFDTVMNDVVTENRGVLTTKVGFMNAIWAGTVLI